MSTGAQVSIPEWTGSTTKTETTTRLTLEHDDQTTGKNIVKLTTGATSCFVLLEELIEAVQGMRRLIRAIS